MAHIPVIQTQIVLTLLVHTAVNVEVVGLGMVSSVQVNHRDIMIFTAL